MTRTLGSSRVPVFERGVRSFCLVTQVPRLIFKPVPLVRISQRLPYPYHDMATSEPKPGHHTRLSSASSLTLRCC